MNIDDKLLLDSFLEQVEEMIRSGNLSELKIVFDVRDKLRACIGRKPNQQYTLDRLDELFSGDGMKLTQPDLPDGADRFDVSLPTARAAIIQRQAREHLGGYGAASPVFRDELRALLNRHSIDQRTNTPDFALAQFVSSCLIAYEAANILREMHQPPASLLAPLVEVPDEAN